MQHSNSHPVPPLPLPTPCMLLPLSQHGLLLATQRRAAGEVCVPLVQRALNSPTTGALCGCVLCSGSSPYLVTLPGHPTCWSYLLALPGHPTCWPYLVTLPVGPTWSPYLLALPVGPTWSPYLVALPVGPTWSPYLVTWY